MASTDKSLKDHRVLPADTGLPVHAIVVRLLVVVSLAELAIMLLFSWLRLELDPVAEALLDAGLLATVSAPIVYGWIVKPFVRARDEAVAMVRQLALQDPLTGLPNRRLLEESLSQVLRERQRDKAFSALLLLDLDGFKPVNDTFGHEAGDFLLCAVGLRIRSGLRDCDLCARLGGDEFVILLDRVGTEHGPAAANALLVANKVLAAVAQPLDYEGAPLKISGSMGVRLIGAGGGDAEALLRDADSAMYAAKKAGRAQVRLFAPERDAAAG